MLDRQWMIVGATLVALCGGCGDGGTTQVPDGGVSDPDGSMGSGGEPCDTDGALRCGNEGVEQCAGGAWTLEQPCPGSCSDAACDDGPVSCTPGATRCFRSSVSRCNLAGTAWVWIYVAVGAVGAILLARALDRRNWRLTA